jgi:hypothetical protein
MNGKLRFVTHLTYNTSKSREILQRRDLTTDLQKATHTARSSSENFRTEYTRCGNLLFNEHLRNLGYVRKKFNMHRFFCRNGNSERPNISIPAGFRKQLPLSQIPRKSSHSSPSNYCYRHYRFKSCNGPAIQVQTLNGLMEIHSFWL